MNWNTHEGRKITLVFGEIREEVTLDGEGQEYVTRRIVEFARKHGLYNFTVDVGDSHISDPNTLPEIKGGEVLSLSTYAKAG